MPYIEQNNAYQAAPMTAAATVIAIYFCPSRRSPVALAGIQNGLPDGCLRGAIDYAGCGGFGPYDFPSGLPNNGILVASPGALGIRNGSISIRDVSDGVSNTLLVGERNYNRNYRNQSWPWDENDGYIDGYDWDVIRWGNQPPIPDRRDNSYYSYQFGSSHPGACQFVFDDGSVRVIHYGINPTLFQALCRRKDGQAVNLGGLKAEANAPRNQGRLGKIEKSRRPVRIYRNAAMPSLLECRDYGRKLRVEDNLVCKKVICLFWNLAQGKRRRGRPANRRSAYPAPEVQLAKLS